MKTLRQIIESAIGTVSGGLFVDDRNISTEQIEQKVHEGRALWCAQSYAQTKQVHGARVVESSGTPADWVNQEADALVARRGSGDSVGVRIADCVPILLADTASGDVAAVHAGWRGIAGRAIEAAVRHLSSPSKIVAAIGPSIGVCCFEVSIDIAKTIAASAAGANVLRAHSDAEKAFVDLRAAARAQLVHLGVANDQIEDVPGCTRCDAERFYSFRRDGDNAGRLIGVITAKA